MRISNKGIIDYRTEDFLKDESFIDWIKSGKSNDDFWSKHVKHHPESSVYITDAEEIIGKISFKEDDPTKYRVERIKMALDANIKKKSDGGNAEVYPLDTSGPYSESTKKTLYFKALSAAAVIAMIIASIWVFQSVTKNELENKLATITKVTGKGQKLTVHLRDGSTVKMNSGSSIKYNDYFTDSSRVVYLTGEAFFEVAKDSNRPFKVITENSITTALGTSFNVKSQKLDNSIAVSLLSGKVSVENLIDSNIEKVIIEPGQQAIINGRQPILIKPFDLDVLSWKEGVLVFKKDSHLEVFEKLESWYGVKFQINSD